MQTSPNTAEQSASLTVKDVPVVTVAEMQRILIRRMAERFKDINPSVADRIDAAAAEITGRYWAKKIIGVNDPALGGATARTALHIESQAAQGKTFVINAAARRFADIAGLNLVDGNTCAENYIPTKNDCYFFTVNMIGQYNTSEAGGLPIRLRLGGEASSETLIQALRNRAEGIADIVDKEVSFIQTEVSGLDAADLSVTFEKEAVAQRSAKKLRDWAAARLNESGAKLVMLEEGETPRDDAFSMRVAVRGAAMEIQYFEPKKQLREMNVMGKLPNSSWAKASNAACCIMFVDEIDKISPAIRHLLLEIAQFGRVSGTASLGEHFMVVTAGNLGDRGYENDHNDSISQSTVAETTRRETYVILNTPEDWAEYACAKYPGSDHAHITSFIRNYGKQPGIFTPNLADPAFDPNKPCAAARSIEAAMVRAMSAFAEADAAGVPRSYIYDDRTFHNDILALVGEPFTSAYVSHVKAMEMQAVPLADHIFNARSERLDDIEAEPLRFADESTSFIGVLEHKTGQFAFTDPEHKLFAQRLSDALVTRSVNAYLDAKDDADRAKALTRGFVGLALLSQEAHNAGVAQINRQLRKLEIGDGLTGESADRYLEAAGKAISAAARSGFHHVPGLSREQQEAKLTEVKTDITQIITGHRASKRPTP